MTCAIDCGVQVGSDLTVTLTLLRCGTTSPLDISTQTALEIVILSPQGTRVAKTATLVNTGTDGKMTADFVPAEIDIDGEWKVQGYATLAGPLVYPTEVKRFKVRANI